MNIDDDGTLEALDEPIIIRIHRDIVSCKVVDVDAIISNESKMENELINLL